MSVPVVSLSYSGLTNVSVTLVAVDNSTGGKTILEREYYVDDEFTAGGGPTMDARAWTGQAGGATTRFVGNLLPNKLYYAWTYARNADGWSEISPRIAFRTEATWSVPPAPNAPTYSELTAYGVRVAFTNNGNGGQVLEEFQIGRATEPAGPTSFYNGTNVYMSGLNPGTWYYFWSRVRNKVGWSAWSPIMQVFTPTFPQAPNPVVVSEVTQNSVRAVLNFDGRWDGNTPILEWELSWGTNPQFSSAVRSGWNEILAELEPGRTYYIWSRARNATGWGPYSTPTAVTLKAGAYVNVGGQWKRAVPYVKQNGVWKMAKPWTKIAGVWKEDQ